MSKPVLTCWGGVGAVTGANFLFEIENKKYLIDCGLLQGVADADATNAARFDYDPASIDILFVTHAHADHIGKIPKLVRDGFRGTIYSTPETREISVLMLADMAKINDSNASTNGVAPLYTQTDVDKALGLWQTIKYHEPKEFEGFKLELLDAGHILGSCMYKFTFPSGKSMVFTGDLGNSPSPILRDTEQVIDATYLLMESVYGDRNHESKEERDQEFKQAIVDAIDRRGTIVIPIFALERTQDILFELDNLFESHAVPEVPVFLDSPLAIKVTEIFEGADRKLFNAATQDELGRGDDIFKFKRLKETSQVRDSREIAAVAGPKIILAGSGMSTAGRVLDHEHRYLPDPNATILIVGYQAPGTLGRQIVEGNKKVSINGTSVVVQAKIVVIEGFSGHMDADHLVEFVSRTRESLNQVFVTMGEPKTSIFLAQRLHDELDVKAIVPERGKHYELDL